MQFGCYLSFILRDKSVKKKYSLVPNKSLDRFVFYYYCEHHVYCHLCVYKYFFFVCAFFGLFFENKNKKHNDNYKQMSVLSFSIERMIDSF